MNIELTKGELKLVAHASDRLSRNPATVDLSTGHFSSLKSLGVLKDMLEDDLSDAAGKSDSDSLEVAFTPDAIMIFLPYLDHMCRVNHDMAERVLLSDIYDKFVAAVSRMRPLETSQ